MPELPMIPAEGGIQQANYARPPIAPGAGVEGLREGADATESMIAEMSVHINDIKAQEQSNAANSEYVNKMTDTAQDILDNPKFRTDRIAASDEFMRQMAPVRDAMLVKYPMANRYGALARNMDIDFAHSSRVIQHRAFINDQEDTENNVVGSKPMAVANATNPKFDEPTQARFYHDYIGGLIKPAVDSGMIMPGKGAALQNAYMYEVNQKLFENYARANPGSVLAMTTIPDAKDVLPKWVMDAAPSSTILPEWMDAAKKQAVEKLESTGKAIDASVAADRGNMEARIVSAKNNNQPVNGLLNDYMAHGGRQEFYEAFTGEQWIRSNPSLRDSLIGQIKAAKPEEIPYILESATMYKASQQLSGTDLAAVAQVGVQAHKAGATEEARAQKNWVDSMYDEFVPKGTNPMSKFMGSMTPKVDRTALAHDLNKAWSDAKGDPVKASEIIEKQYAPYKLKGSADIKGAYDRMTP